MPQPDPPWGSARDKIALEAMKSLLRHPNSLMRDPMSTVDAIAQIAYRQADAMLRTRLELDTETTE